MRGFSFIQITNWQREDDSRSAHRTGFDPDFAVVSFDDPFDEDEEEYDDFDEWEDDDDEDYDEDDFEDWDDEEDF